MAAQGFFSKALNLVTNCRLLFNNRPIQITQIAGVKHKYIEKLKELNVPEKPKRPLTAYFKFVQDHRAQVIKEHPSWKITEVSKQCASDWKSIDPALKERYESEYKSELEAYAKQWNEYSKKLTDEQKEAIKDYNADVKNAKVRRRLRKKYRENNRPKRPVGAYMLFVMEQAKNKNKKYSELLSDLKKEWAHLPHEKKCTYLQSAAKAVDQYEEVLLKWELKMIEEGKLDIVRHSTLEKRLPKTKCE